MVSLKTPALFSAMLPKSTTTSLPSFLDQARELKLPTREEMLRRDQSVAEFWARNDEWSETKEAASLTILDESLIHSNVCKAFEEAWKDPNKEYLVGDLWEEVSPGVYQCQFLDPEKIDDLRAYFDKAAKAGIPTHPPYGIVLNRKGFMLDPRSNGYLAIPEFQKFHRNLIDTCMHPLCHLFFPDFIQAQDDLESFGSFRSSTKLARTSPFVSTPMLPL